MVISTTEAASEARALPACVSRVRATMTAGRHEAVGAFKDRRRGQGDSRRSPFGFGSVPR